MENNEFDKYFGEARDRYVNFICSLPWDTKTRTEAENLLICFDQMRERITTTASHTMEWVKDNELIKALKKIEQMSDPGSELMAIWEMKSIATDALKAYKWLSSPPAPVQ